MMHLNNYAGAIAVRFERLVQPERDIRLLA